MKILALSTLALAAGLSGFAVHADTEGSASSHVFVDVTANIAIAPPQGDVDLGDQMNDFEGAATFSIKVTTQLILTLLHYLLT